MMQQSLFGPGKARKKGVSWEAASSKEPGSEHIDILADMLAQGQIVPQVEKIVPLKDAADAVAYVEKGHATAKIVLTI